MAARAACLKRGALRTSKPNSLQPRHGDEAGELAGAQETGDGAGEEGDGRVAARRRAIAAGERRRRVDRDRPNRIGLRCFAGKDGASKAEREGEPLRIVGGDRHADAPERGGTATGDLAGERLEEARIMRRDRLVAAILVGDIAQFGEHGGKPFRDLGRRRCHVVERRTLKTDLSHIVKRPRLPRATRSSPTRERLGASLRKRDDVGR